MQEVNNRKEMEQKISAHAFADETECVHRLLTAIPHLTAADARIHDRAAALVESLREKRGGFGMESFLHEYGLDTPEGVSLMCLAEALLRIPDAETADRLIRDKFERAEWDKHIGHSDSLLLNASNWGLLLTGKWLSFSTESGGGIMARLAEKFGEPVIREALKKAMRLIGSRFVMGETMSDALKHAEKYTRHGYRMSYDMLGEGARTEAQAESYVQAYQHAITLLGKQTGSVFEAPGISVKLSALHSRYQLSQAGTVISELLPRLQSIMQHAKETGITVSIDAEESTRLDIELELFAALFSNSAFEGWEGIGFVLQAYQKRAFDVIDYLSSISQAHRRRIPLRLVKGAYWDSEIKWAQMSGLPNYPVFTRKEHTDISYLACADKIMSRTDCFYPQFATHNASTAASIETLATRYGVQPNAYEFQRLHGMGEALHDALLTHTPSRVYAPVGQHKDLLAYLIRRLLENGANTSFVHLLMDAERDVEDIIADPIRTAAEHGCTPSPSIPLPRNLYGTTHKNSEGLDFGNKLQIETLQQQMQPHLATSYKPVPEYTGEGVSKALNSAQDAFPAWSETPVHQRAEMLEKAADMLESHRADLITLLAREAGKTLPDGNAEIREAADFCRYYAAQARTLMQPQTLLGPAGECNTLSLYPRGVFTCISPWNFPLAIFTGQIAAALATGNCAVAKPAAQTPLIAARAVELLHEAGIPKHALQLLPGSGEIVGMTLMRDARVNGVVFTGSTQTAKRIAQTLAARGGPLVPLIAETGGQNCMVVDSSALLEQAVDDILLSAFGSAGQRCSALRVLFVQEEVADALLELISGAMQQLRLGDPLLLSTDIGPVIDEKAKEALQSHIEHMKKTARLINATPLPDALPPRAFVAPHAFEIKNIAELAQENFGPVLHIIRFKSSEMQRVADEINSTGFGLTFGIHSRIDGNVRFFAERVKVGNTYVNRSMTGAVVGVQPFGGEGLSGTGPKAGGPHYLQRFLTERTLTINSAAIGGNVALLSGKDTP